MNFISKTGLVLLCVTAWGSAVLAQGPGGGFGDFREKHKSTFELMQMVRQIGAIDRDSKHALRPEQAKRVIAVLKPLRSKRQLTQDQARQTLKALKPIFTADQQKAMAAARPPERNGRQGFGGRPGVGPGRSKAPGDMRGMAPGGRPGGPPPGGPMRMNPAAMANFNPFFVDPKAKDGMAARHAKRMDAFFVRLGKESKGIATRHGITKSKA